MIRFSAGSLLLVILAALSVSPALAAPQGRPHASHSPYKDYDSDPSHKRQNLDLPNSADSCALSAGELPATGDKELVSDGVHYSQVCLEQLGFTFVPEERAVCRTTVRGYDMSCVAEQVVHRSAETDLTQLRDTKQPVSRMAPTAATDCAVLPEEALLIPSDGVWTPFTVVGNQAFDNDCLTRFYLQSFSSTASCLPDDNACMLDSALSGIRDAVGSGAAPDLPDVLPAQSSAE